MERLKDLHAVFPAAVGPHALSGELQAALQVANIPCVGPSSPTLPEISDKARCCPAWPERGMPDQGG